MLLPKKKYTTVGPTFGLLPAHNPISGYFPLQNASGNKVERAASNKAKQRICENSKYEGVVERWGKKRGTR